MIKLTHETACLGLRPDLGGSIVFWRVLGRDVVHPTVDPHLAAQKGEAIAAYPLIPFSNRVGAGHFRFEGQDYQLHSNFGGGGTCHSRECLATGLGGQAARARARNARLSA